MIDWLKTFHPGKEKIAELLIQKGANIEAINGREETPLHLASSKGY